MNLPSHDVRQGLSNPPSPHHPEGDPEKNLYQESPDDHSNPSAFRLTARLNTGSGFPTLLRKEFMRFWKVSIQTIAAPVVTAILYLLVFAHVLQNRIQVYGVVPYTSFLVPGLIMMSMLQNAFSNPSSSLIQSRVTGNLIFILLPPLSHHNIYFAYVLAGILRGLMVGIVFWLVALIFIPLTPAHWGWMLTFAILACGIMGSLGIIAGLYSEKYDQLALFQNFLIMPITFLSGVFYSIHTLPTFWQKVSHWNPIFYTIDGFRYGFFSISDVSPWRSLTIVSSVFFVLAIYTEYLLASGYKLRN